MFKNIWSTLLMLALLVGGIWGIYYFFNSGKLSSSENQDLELSEKTRLRREASIILYNMSKENYPEDDVNNQYKDFLDNEDKEVYFSSKSLEKGTNPEKNDIFAEAYKVKYDKNTRTINEEIVYDMDKGKYIGEKSGETFISWNDYYASGGAGVLHPKVQSEYAFVVVKDTLFGRIPYVYANTKGGGIIFDPPLDPIQFENLNTKAGIDFGDEKYIEHLDYSKPTGIFNNEK